MKASRVAGLRRIPRNLVTGSPRDIFLEWVTTPMTQRPEFQE